MRPTIGRHSIAKVCILLYLLNSYYYFCIPILKFFIMEESFESRILTIGRVLTILIFLCILPEVRAFFYAKFRKEIFLLIVSFTISAVMAGSKFGQMDYAIDRLIWYFDLPLLFFSLFVFFSVTSPRELKHFFISFTKCNVFFCVLMNAQALIYNATQNMLLYIVTYASRNNTVRYRYSTELVTFSLLLSIAMIVDKNGYKKGFHALNLFVSICYLAYVSQSRSNLFLCCGGIVIALVFGYKTDTTNKLITKCSIFFVGLAMVLAVAYSSAQVYFNLDVKSHSVTARTGAFDYYLFSYEKNFFYGVVFINEHLDSRIESIVHGGMQGFYPSDVGIIGNMVDYGILTAIVYLVMVLHLCIICLERFKYSNHFFYLLMIYYALVSMPTLSFLTYDRFIICVFTLLFIECDYWLTSPKMNNQLEAIMKICG